MPKKSKQVEGIHKELTGLVEGTVGKVQLRCWQALSSATPVATGFARSAWIPSLGSADTAPLARPKSEKAARAEARTKRAFGAAQAKQIAASYKVAQGRVFISNNVGYVEYLNRGSSAQAPAMFVEKAIETAVKSFGGRRL